MGKAFMPRLWDRTVTSGVSFFICRVELDIRYAVFEPELECDSSKLGSVIGKDGNEFIFQGHPLQTPDLNRAPTAGPFSPQSVWVGLKTAFRRIQAIFSSIPLGTFRGRA